MDAKAMPIANARRRLRRFRQWRDMESVRYQPSHEHATDVAMVTEISGSRAYGARREKESDMTSADSRCDLPRTRVLVIAAGIVLWSAAVAAATTFDHRALDAIVRTHIDDAGEVAYRNLRERDREQLNAYLERLGAAVPDELDRSEQFAFWINAYNAVILAGVLDGYHAESTLGRYQFFKRYKRRVAGKERTPDEIEHEILRPRFKDFRVHFAVNCASASCPKLRREAYTGARLDEQLDAQAREFLNDPKRNRLAGTEGVVELSQIFEWFAGDFTAEGKTLRAALDRFLTPAQRESWDTAQVRFLKYDWTLNAQPGQRP